jgi:hypothetical protein
VIPARLTLRTAAPVLLVFVLLTVVTSLPYARAFLFPPPGARFVGVFYSIPDVYNYFSYMQQAQEGGFLLDDKLSLDARGPALVNLEWWAVGRFAGLTELSLPLSFRLLGFLASLALVVGMDAWLRRAGLPPSHRLGALLLVFLGGGFGGVLFLVLGPPAWRFLDLTTGLFPFISVLVNPHFVAGTALLVLALLGLTADRLAGRVAGIVLGNVLGLVRPYDLVVRYGGEEFLVLLPLCSSPESIEIAERIRCTLQDAPIIYNHEELSITVSVGIYVAEQIHDLQAAITHADEALYNAKKSGRNRVCLAHSA